MEPFLVSLGSKVIGDIVGKMIAGALKLVANGKPWKQEIIELKLGQIAEQKLPKTIPVQQREALATMLVEIALPSFEQVLEFNPTIQRVKAHIDPGPPYPRSSGKYVAKKAPAKKSSGIISMRGRGSRDRHRPYAAKKASGPVKKAAKKAPARKSLAKKAPARKAPAKKAAKKN